MPQEEDECTHVEETVNAATLHINKNPSDPPSTPSDNVLLLAEDHMGSLPMPTNNLVRPSADFYASHLHSRIAMVGCCSVERKFTKLCPKRVSMTTRFTTNDVERLRKRLLYALENLAFFWSQNVVGKFYLYGSAFSTCRKKGEKIGYFSSNLGCYPKPIHIAAKRLVYMCVPPLPFALDDEGTPFCESYCSIRDYLHHQGMLY